MGVRTRGLDMKAGAAKADKAALIRGGERLSRRDKRSRQAGMNTIALTQAAWRKKCGFAFPASIRN
jgi:hypothetical protein